MQVEQINLKKREKMNGRNFENIPFKRILHKRLIVTKRQTLKIIIAFDI